MWLWLAGAFLAATAGAPAQIVRSVSSPMNDYNLGYDREGRTLVFARSKADFREARIYIATRRRGRWTVARPIEFSDPRYSDSDPWLTEDGRTLYFVSDRPTAARPDKTDLDLWRARRGADGGWLAPEHLGEAVNGPGPELGPEVHGGVLYFNGVRTGGQGGLDIYTAREIDGAFGAPEPLAGPFNSATSESDFTISADGRRAAFWRTIGTRGVIHLSSRTARGWSQPEALPDDVNLGPFNFTPHFSRDGTSLYFASSVGREGQQEGLADIYVVKLGKAPN